MNQTKLTEPSEEYCGQCEAVFDMLHVTEECPNCGKLVVACSACNHTQSTSHCQPCAGCVEGNHFKEHIQKRLVNKYAAITCWQEGEEFGDLIDKNVKELEDYARKHDLDMHDAMSAIIMATTSRFAESFLLQGIKVRKQERKQNEQIHSSSAVS